MIEVRNLTKKYGDHFAIQDISFSLEKGKIYGLLGPNGAGKSTTMNIMTGYIAATSGEVIIEGHDIFKEAEEAKKHIGYLPEIPPLYMDMTVWEYLFTVADLKGVPKSERKSMIGDVMEKVMLTNMKDRLIKNLSKGYKQRVGVAGAMMGYPEILILDEPTVGLDPNQIIQMRELIRDLSESHTILLSSHIMQEISAVCDEIIIINEGKMIACDTPDNLTMHMASNGLHLVIKGDVPVIKGALRTVSGIKNVVYDEQIEEGTLGLTLYSIDKKDLREDVFFALAEAGCPILEMHRQETTLEEAFIALTKGGSRQFGGKKTAEKQTKPEDEKEEE